MYTHIEMNGYCKLHMYIYIYIYTWGTRMVVVIYDMPVTGGVDMTKIESYSKQV